MCWMGEMGWGGKVIWMVSHVPFVLEPDVAMKLTSVCPQKVSVIGGRSLH